MWQIGRFIEGGLGGVMQIVNDSKNSFVSANSRLDLLVFQKNSMCNHFLRFAFVKY